MISRFEAEQELLEEAWTKKVREKLEPLVDAAFIERIGLMSRLERAVLNEDALTEELEEDLWEQAEAQAEAQAEKEWKEEHCHCCGRSRCPA